MKKLNKAVALGMAGTMALSLAACGGGSSTSASASTGDSTASAPASSDEVVTLKWVAVGSGMPSNYDAWLAQINPYLEEKIGVNIDMEIVSWGDWDTRRNVIVNTSGDYDILFTNANVYNNDVNVGAFLDITDMVKEVAPELYASVPEDYWKACEVGGKIYGVPTYKDSSQSEYVVWDKALIEETGYDYTKELGITDLAELTEPLAAIKEKTGDAPFPMFKNGGGYQTYMYDTLSAGLYPLGVRYDDGSAKVVATVEQDDVMGILKTFHDWYNKGIINSDAATHPEENNYKVCGIAQGWSGAAITAWGPQRGAECVAQKWGPTIVSNETVRGSLNCISANCARPDKALEFLQLINTDSYCRDLFFYGVQGDNWDYTDDSKTKVHKNNADWSMAGYTQGSFFTITPTDDFDFNQYDEVKELNEKAEPSVLLGFYLDTTNISDKLANCIQIAERYKGELMTGTADPEVMVPQLMAELRSAGFDDIVAEAQTQVDAFMAANK